MSSVFGNLRSALSRPGHDGSLFECRHCGTTVDGPTSKCPCCDSSEIARFEL